MGKLTQTDASAIASKLQATINKKGKAHDIATIWHDGKFIASYGIRRASRDKGHGHIPGALFVGPHDCHRLADCSMSQADWLAILKAKGKL